jgi:hypothetical protein
MCVLELIRFGANRDLKNKEEKTAIEYARNKEMQCAVKCTFWITLTVSIA